MKKLLILVLASLLLLSCCGCPFVLIHKKDLQRYGNQLTVYRKYVIPINEYEGKPILPSEVNELGDNLEQIIRNWAGAAAPPSNVSASDAPKLVPESP